MFGTKNIVHNTCTKENMGTAIQIRGVMGTHAADTFGIECITEYSYRVETRTQGFCTVIIGTASVEYSGLRMQFYIAETGNLLPMAGVFFFLKSFVNSTQNRVTQYFKGEDRCIFEIFMIG